MKRLTERDKYGQAGIAKLTSLIEVVNKLADFEDAEEQGRLVRLPFSEDAELYAIAEKPAKEGRRILNKEYVVKGEVDRFFFVDGVVHFGVVLDDREAIYISLTVEDIGKTVFLSREEAERAMRRRNMNYDVDSRGIHTVRATLQREDYKGHFTFEIRGNCHGRDILDFDFGCDDLSSISSDCKLEYDGDGHTFSVTLKNDEGAEWVLDVMFAEEMNAMIVGLEIIDFRPEE